MTITQTPGVMSKFRRTPWRFQQTFHTPLRELDRFVPLLFSAHRAVQSASLTINEIIFEPKNLIQLLAENGLLSERDEGVTITTDHADEVVPLLRAALADWVDFLFVPTPKPFVIYADHDEFVTFYANTKSNLNHTVGSLEGHGYKVVQDWQREF